MKLHCVAATILMSSGLACFGEIVNGHLMPSKCKNEDPKTHTQECALMCQSTGFGVLTESGEYLSFDPTGNSKALKLLRSGSRTANLRISVQGARDGSVLVVESIGWN